MALIHFRPNRELGSKVNLLPYALDLACVCGAIGDILSSLIENGWIPYGFDCRYT